MGSISLIAVPHKQFELGILNRDLAARSRQIAIDRMAADPVLAKKVRRILAD